MKMALFKSEEEKRAEEKRKLKETEENILKKREYIGSVGASNTGYSFSEGFRNTDKIRFKKTKFKIYDDKIMIERHKTLINLSDIKEIFQETDDEAIIILNNDNGIPISPVNSKYKSERRELKAFINILNRLIEKNRPNISTNESNPTNPTKSEDKFDKLIKLGEMHDKGLLSDEEFASLKQELLGNNEETLTTPENKIESSTNTCENCGAEVSNEDAFCSECGTQIN